MHARMVVAQVYTILQSDRQVLKSKKVDATYPLAVSKLAEIGRAATLA